MHKTISLVHLTVRFAFLYQDFDSDITPDIAEIAVKKLKKHRRRSLNTNRLSAIRTIYSSCREYFFYNPIKKIKKKNKNNQYKINILKIINIKKNYIHSVD